MSELEPQAARKLAIGVAVIAAATIAAVLVFGGRAYSPPLPAAPTVPNAAEASTGPALPRPAPSEPAPTGPVLDRAALLAGAAAAAAAYGEGAPLPPATAAMAGRRFSLALPFGCDGPATADSSMGWDLGPDGETLRVSVRREDWTASPFAQALGGSEVEAVEGFWMPRPWVRQDRCGAQPADPLLAEAAPPSPQTVGLASVYGAGSSRVSRRGDRPYELTLPLQQVGRPGEQGLLLVIEGRVAPFAGGAPLRCRAANPDQRPVCLIGAEIERVAIRNPATDAQLGEWRDAAPLTPASPAPTAG